MNDQPINDMITATAAMFAALIVRANGPMITMYAVQASGDLIIPPLHTDAFEALAEWADIAPAWIGARVARALLVFQQLSMITHERAATEARSHMRRATHREVRRLHIEMGKISTEFDRDARS